jgi:hypothetical protein
VSPEHRYFDLGTPSGPRIRASRDSTSALAGADV